MQRLFGRQISEELPEVREEDREEDEDEEAAATSEESDEEAWESDATSPDLEVRRLGPPKATIKVLSNPVDPEVQFEAMAIMMDRIAGGDGRGAPENPEILKADFEVESLFVPTTGCGRILGAATVEAVCSGRGLLCGQIGCLEKSGGGTALVHHMVHYARNLRCSFLVASPLDKDAAGFWRAAGLKALRKAHPESSAGLEACDLAELRRLQPMFAPSMRIIWPCTLPSNDFSWTASVRFLKSGGKEKVGSHGVFMKRNGYLKELTDKDKVRDFVQSCLVPASQGKPCMEEVKRAGEEAK
eukprot:symbB.v1.2.026589.t1/scaffold2671.1/size73327/5